MTTTSISIAPEDPESLNFSNENEIGFDENENGQESTASGAANTAAEMGMLISDTADDKDGDGEEITFPESSHSFLFTEPVKSIPFVFGLVIVTMSYLCLIIAFIDNFKQLEIPVNVSPSVRVAQYMGELLMYRHTIISYIQLIVLHNMCTTDDCRYSRRSINGGRNPNSTLSSQENIKTHATESIPRDKLLEVCRVFHSALQYGLLVFGQRRCHFGKC